MEKWCFRLAMILGLIGGGCIGYACDKKWPIQSLEKARQGALEECKKNGGRHYGAITGCIFDIETGLKPVEKKDE